MRFKRAEVRGDLKRLIITELLYYKNCDETSRVGVVYDPNPRYIKDGEKVVNRLNIGDN